MDVAALTAIDVHTHVHRSARATSATESDEAMASMAKYFKTGAKSYTVDELAAFYRTQNMAAVTFTVDVKDAPSRPDQPGNEEIAERAHANSDVLIPFASVDPARGKEGVRQARRLIEEYGVRGFKFHPTAQAFQPDDRSAYPLYEVIQEAGLPALFHTGQTGAGAGQRGGGGLRLRYSNPIHLDDVAADFPDLTIIMAHPSFPWQEEAISVALHKPLVHIDLSGWSPKYFPPVLVQYANTLLKDKVLFGTDFPMLTPERWLADLAKTEIRDEVKPRLLKDNAVRVLGLG
ncbi:amidohydrolase family protein [Amycolatopsis acidiphila]|uniref:Amidohydrolase n=1 Tax=Amycolatopsis acidiphila TaxID=715473 RepID=A0A558A3D7_9PSEU|nr:amidohydrolase [Amycolatopsis acidiphila]UIJ63939.1 amidohydrolase family protein [Amycolatopsis acidiphila]